MEVKNTVIRDEGVKALLLEAFGDRLSAMILSSLTHSPKTTRELCIEIKGKRLHNTVYRKVAKLEKDGLISVVDVKIKNGARTQVYKCLFDRIKISFDKGTFTIETDNNELESLLRDKYKRSRAPDYHKP